MIYLLVFIVLVVLTVLEQVFDDPVSKRILLCVAGVLLALFAGFRYQTGGDWPVYTEIFAKTPVWSVLSHRLLTTDIEGIEPGFLALISLIKTCGGNVQTLFLLVACFDILLISISLPRYTRYPVMALLCYYGILYLNLEFIYIRQAMAVAICFFAFRYIVDKRFWRFAALVLAAALIQRVAIVMLLLYFVAGKRYSRTAYCIIIGLGCVIFLLHVPWFESLFSALTRWAGGAVAEKGAYYSQSAEMAVERGLSIGFFINLALFAVVMYFKQEIEEQKYGTIHLNVYVLSLAVYYYCYELVEVSNRTRLMFLISVIVVLPHLVTAFRDARIRALATGVVALYCFTFSMGIMLESPRAVAYNPYQSYLLFRNDNSRRSDGAKRLQQSNKAFKDDRK